MNNYLKNSLFFAVILYSFPSHAKSIVGEDKLLARGEFQGIVNSGHFWSTEFQEENYLPEYVDITGSNISGKFSIYSILINSDQKRYKPGDDINKFSRQINVDFEFLLDPIEEYNLILGYNHFGYTDNRDTYISHRSSFTGSAWSGRAVLSADETLYNVGSTLILDYKDGNATHNAMSGTGRFGYSYYYFENHGFSGTFDITSGWVEGVPEPATWSLMIAGFGFVGANLRRQRQKTALQSIDYPASAKAS